MSTQYPLPTLRTLNTKPSWHNRAWRVDRSACFVMTASKHWREIPEERWTYRLGLPPSEHWRLNNPRPASDVRGIKGVCDRYADLTLWARDLWLLHKAEHPYPLRGDFRTGKANALRAHPRPTGPRPHNRPPRAQWVREDSILGHGPVNPNRGLGFNQYKMLGLDSMWHTTLRIERIVQHANLRQHFFVCPVCGLASSPNPQHLKPNTQARLSGRCTKLYLPLCTPREWEDALIAQLWLTSHPHFIAHPNRPLPTEVVQVLNRYGELFEPRQLRCRQCLGLRYGEAKPHQSTKRQRVAFTHEDPGHSLTLRALTNQPPRVARRLTEQSLFLTNLPKLLETPVALPPPPTGEDIGEGLAEGRATDASNPTSGSAAPSPQASPAGRGGKSVDALPDAAKEKLMLLLAGRLPAFQKIKGFKESEHDA
ncbi:MAG: hypothetical protein AAGB26_03235 [Planctomycetota bacterium]